MKKINYPTSIINSESITRGANHQHNIQLMRSYLLSGGGVEPLPEINTSFNIYHHSTSTITLIGHDLQPIQPFFSAVI